jgi:hypothetical protein
MKSTISWDVTPCSLVEIYLPHFRAYSRHFLGWSISQASNRPEASGKQSMKVHLAFCCLFGSLFGSEDGHSMNFYHHTTWRHISRESAPQSLPWEPQILYKERRRAFRNKMKLREEYRIDKTHYNYQDAEGFVFSINIVACRPVAMQRPRDKQIYK